MLQKLRERFADILKARAEGEAGFTLVELLVVMLILGLLAAIAIPAFFNQRDKAYDANAKASVRTAETAMETYSVDNGGSYANATPTALEKIEPTLNNAPGNSLTVAAGGGTGDTAANSYKVTVTAQNTGDTFSITRHNDGTSTLTCTTGGNAGCPTGGDWSNG